MCWFLFVGFYCTQEKSKCVRDDKVSSSRGSYTTDVFSSQTTHRHINVYYVLKCHVQFCLIASLIAHAHGKCVLCLKFSNLCYQSHNIHVNYTFNYHLYNCLLMRRCDFTQIVEVESRNVHDVGEQTIASVIFLNHFNNISKVSRFYEQRTRLFLFSSEFKSFHNI